MKIEQLLVQYFYIAKEVTLQGLGTFRLSPDFVMPMENDVTLKTKNSSKKRSTMITPNQGMMKAI
jgi:hypothetical protein